MTGPDQLPLVPAPGTDGLVARFPGLALFVAGPGDDDSTLQFLDRCRKASASPHPGAVLAANLPAWVQSSPKAPPPFAVVAETTDGWLAIVHGPVAVTGEGPGGPIDVVGGAAPGCTVQPLGAHPTSLVVVGNGHTSDGSSPAVNLERGVVMASGFSLAAPAEAPLPTPGAGAPPEFRTVSLTEVDDDDDVRPPLPVEADPVRSRSAESEIGQVIVQGVVCPRGHFNDPRSRHCSSCAISMSNHTLNPMSGPRPPLGVLVFDDGTTYSLSTNYVIGRQPETHSAVQQHQALPLTIEDSQRTISRAHAEIRLEGWDVHFINLSATNGSYLWDANYQQWMPLTAGHPVLLTPGMRFALGQRSAVFESALIS